MRSRTTSGHGDFRRVVAAQNVPLNRRRRSFRLRIIHLDQVPLMRMPELRDPSCCGFGPATPDSVCCPRPSGRNAVTTHPQVTGCRGMLPACPNPDTVRQAVDAATTHRRSPVRCLRDGTDRHIAPVPVPCCPPTGAGRPSMQSSPIPGHHIRHDCTGWKHQRASGTRVSLSGLPMGQGHPSIFVFAAARRRSRYESPAWSDLR
jgi:hypothetical protein